MWHLLSEVLDARYLLFFKETPFFHVVCILSLLQRLLTPYCMGADNTPCFDECMRVPTIVSMAGVYIHKFGVVWNKQVRRLLARTVMVWSKCVDTSLFIFDIYWKAVHQLKCSSPWTHTFMPASWTTIEGLSGTDILWLRGLCAPYTRETP